MTIDLASSVQRVAALYVETGGIYFGRDDVDPWDEARDARNYAGPWPVVAHPPCSTWCQMASVNQERYGHKIGSDGGCFDRALWAVRNFGGVLEHPAYSLAWDYYRLPKPRPGSWQCTLFEQGWVTEVSQVAYGHAARKRTWILYVGDTSPPRLDWSEPDATAQVSYGRNKDGEYWKQPLTKKEAKASPPAFAELLISIAKGAR